MNWQKIETQIREAIAANNDKMLIPDTPEYQLALNTSMPEDHPYENGHIGFQLSDFKCGSIDDVKLVTEKCKRVGDTLHLTLKLGAFEVNSQYAIKAKYAPVVNMDTAGTLFDYEDKPRYAKAAGADTNDTVAPISDGDKQAMLDNARAQRANLMKTKNGQVAMAHYNEHQEIYNFMFMKSAAARASWQTGGYSQQMAVDTQTNTQTGATGPINPNDPIYGGQTYNERSFNQQLNVMTNSLFTMPGFNIMDPNPKLDPNNRWVKAALAALNFGKGSDTASGNTKSKINPLSQAEVNSTVDSFAGSLPTSTTKELLNIIEQGIGAGGADEDAESNNWRILDEEERAMVRNFAHAAIEEAAFDKSNVSRNLWTGDCKTTIDATTVTLKLTDGQPLEDADYEINLPAFEFNLDDAHWTDKTAEVVRERMASIYFVRSMIHDKIESGIHKMFAATFPIKNIFPA